MSRIKTIRTINVATASFPISLELSSRVEKYKIYGTKALSVDVHINPSGTPSEGMVVLIDYTATITTTTLVSRFGDYSFNIFSTKVPYSFLAKKCKIWCEYVNGTWSVFILPSIDSIPFNKLESLDLTDILDGSTLDADGTTGKMKIKTGGVTGTQLASGAVNLAIKIADYIITLAKLDALARGSIIVGNASNRPTAFDAKTSAQILIGDGSDLKSVPISGDITITAAGVVAIGAAKVLAAMIKSGELTNIHINAAAGIAFSKMAALAASEIPSISAGGVIQASGIASAYLNYINVSSPGTREVNKAIVVGPTGAIDALNIIALTLNSTLITATAAEINYLSGATSNIQDQIDAAFVKETYTTISGDTTATSADLKHVYYIETGGGAVNLTMPDATTVEAGFLVTIIQKGANAATMVAHAGQNIENKLGADVASLAASGNGGWFTVLCDGISLWKVQSTS
jgi:hypothetical protein